MKKPSAKQKTSAGQAKKKRPSPLDTIFSGVDIEGLRNMLLDAVATEDGSVEDMITEFVSAEPTSLDEMPDSDAIAELCEELDRLRIDANGGDPEAREALKRARGLIDEAAERDLIHPGILMILGRAFAGSQVDIGDPARASMGRMVLDGLFHEPGDQAYRELVQPLFNALEGDDFSLHEEVRCLSAIFPSDYRARIVECFAADARDRARRGAAGFLLDPDEAIALAAVRGLAASAARRGLDVVSRRRVALIRPWLPAARREALDRAFPPGDSASEEASASVVKTVASACDGSGAATLIATVKRGARFAVVALMTKPSGIADLYLVEDLPKVKAEALAVSARGGSTCAETPFETWLRLLRLALGRNLASGSPPPFGTVQAMEALGLEFLVPDVSTTADVIDSLLADFPARNDADMIEEAHKAVLGAEAAGDWFEAGEAVEDLLRSTANPEAGARALLEIFIFHDGAPSGRISAR